MSDRAKKAQEILQAIHAQKNEQKVPIKVETIKQPKEWGELWK
jgi:hypothetical protein